MLLKVLLLCNASLNFELSLKFLDIIFYFSAVLLIFCFISVSYTDLSYAGQSSDIDFLWFYCVSSFLLVHCGPFLPTCSCGRDASTIALVIHLLREAAPHASCLAWLSLLLLVRDVDLTWGQPSKRLTSIYKCMAWSQYCAEINKDLLS